MGSYLFSLLLIDLVSCGPENRKYPLLQIRSDQSSSIMDPLSFRAPQSALSEVEREERVVFAGDTSLTCKDDARWD